jgi:hypothetical protein
VTTLSALALIGGQAAVDASPIVLPKRHRIAGVRVRHLSDDLESALAIGTGEFRYRSDARERTFVSANDVSGAVAAIARSRPSVASGVFPDIRWSVVLFDARRAALLVVYADRFVLDGAVGAADVTFENAAPLSTWLHAHDPLK